MSVRERARAHTNLDHVKFERFVLVVSHVVEVFEVAEVHDAGGQREPHLAVVGARLDQRDLVGQRLGVRVRGQRVPDGPERRADGQPAPGQVLERVDVPLVGLDAQLGDDGRLEQADDDETRGRARHEQQAAGRVPGQPVHAHAQHHLRSNAGRLREHG